MNRIRVDREAVSLVSFVCHGIMLAKARFRLLTFIALCLWPLNSGAQDTSELPKKSDGVESHDNKEKAAEEEIAIDCQALIEHHPTNFDPDFLVAKLDLPALDGGKKYRLNIMLVNPLESPIQFSGVSVSCGCAKFVAEGREIPANGQAEFVMHLDVPNQIPTGRGVQAAKFSGLDPSKDVLMLRIEYDVRNVFAFTRDRVLVEIPKAQDLVVVGIPFRFVAPITQNDLKLELSKELGDFSANLLFDDKNSEIGYVQLEAARQVIPRLGIVGEIVLRHAGGKIESRTVLHLTHRAIFTLRPESLRFVYDSESKTYQATAMLKVPVAEESEANDTEKTVDGADRKGGVVRERVPPKVGLRIADEVANVVVTRRGTTDIYQLTIRYDSPEIKSSSDKSNLQWKIDVNGVEQIIESYAIFSNR